MKLSCCSLRRISRTRKLVLTIKPAISTANRITPRNSMTPSRQFRMIQPTLSATASATRPTPSTMKKAIVFRRLEICMTTRPLGMIVSRAAHGATGVLARQHNSKVASGLQTPLQLENEIAKRRQKLAPRVRVGKHCREEAESPSGDDTRRARTPVAPKKGGSKAALIRQNQEPLIRELRRHQPAIRRGYQALLDLGQIHLANVPRQAKRLQRLNPIPIQIHFVPRQPMPCRGRMRMVIVVPSFTEGEYRHQEVVRGEIASRKPPRSPHVRNRIHRPGRVQPDHGAHENSPHHKGQAP